VLTLSGRSPAARTKRMVIRLPLEKKRLETGRGKSKGCGGKRQYNRKRGEVGLAYVDLHARLGGGACAGKDGLDITL